MSILFIFQTGHTALQRACAEGHVEVVKQLVGRGCPIDHQDDIVRIFE
jgi:ankyrin repeat protein